MDNNTLIEKFYISSLTNENIAKKQQFLSDNCYIVERVKIDEYLPCTPTKTGFLDENDIPITMKSLFCHLGQMGVYPVVYEGENDGRLVRNVVPKEGMERQISSYGSKESFLPHVDNPDLALRSEITTRYKVSPCPDTLTLLCLRKEDGVATSIIKLDSILADLTKIEIEILQQNLFIVSRPASFQEVSILKNVPLLSLYKQNYISRFDYHNVSSENVECTRVLEKFKKISLDETKWLNLYLQPSELVTFDNQRVLHTRNGFSARFDGYDRWLLRVFGLYKKPNSNHLLKKDCNHHLKVDSFL